jgi:hypothetical protein
MKYHIVVANPIDLGFTPENTKMCSEAMIDIYIGELAKSYPNEPIVVMKPIALYKTKCHVETTKFSINNKMEILPA